MAETNFDAVAGALNSNSTFTLVDDVQGNTQIQLPNNWNELWAATYGIRDFCMTIMHVNRNANISYRIGYDNSNNAIFRVTTDNKIYLYSLVADGNDVTTNQNTRFTVFMK